MWSYEKEQENLRALLEDLEAKEDSHPDVFLDKNPDDEESDYEPDHQEIQEENSDTEEDIDDADVDQEFENPNSPRLSFIGKDKTTFWKTHPAPLRSVRTRQENIIKRLPGPTRVTRVLKNTQEIWSHFINEDIINLIVHYTNLYIDSIKEKFSRARDANPTNPIELKAFIGLLYMAGLCKANRLNTEDLWRNDGYGVEIFRLTMSLQRFRFLARCIRFDNKNTRPDRLKLDKLAAIREIFGLFVANCESGYHMSEFVTIDEMLPGFRGKCNFRMYIPSKPTKYGIKIFALSDAKMFYTSKLEVYVGSQPEGPFMVSNSPSDVVYRLATNLKNSGRNLTIDNWFTSVPLVKTLLKDYKITVIGTIRKNKRELPLQFTNPLGRPEYSSMFGFNQDCTLVSYIPKARKNVLLVSSLHLHSDEIDPKTGDRNKPVIITEYNGTKGGVDTVDRLCSNYNCSRNTRRWPMVIFYHMLNIAGINSQIIFQTNNPESHLLRRNYLRNLANTLIRPQLESRAIAPFIPMTMKLRLQEICEIRHDSGQQESKPGRCKFCNWRKNRKTRFSCFLCNTFMCLEHITAICRCCQENHLANNN